MRAAELHTRCARKRGMPSRMIRYDATATDNTSGSTLFSCYTLRRRQVFLRLPRASLPANTRRAFMMMPGFMHMR